MKIYNTMRRINTFIFLILMVTIRNGFSQSHDSTNTVTSYREMVGYFSFILPLVTVNRNETTNDFSDFSNGFAIGFPVGINILYSDKFGFSYEITPTIVTSNGSSKTSKILFDPGPMFRFKRGFTFIPRLAFETSGRYGVTPVFNEIIKRTKEINYFVAASLPIRVGNGELPSVGGNLQFGLIFN
jgi:hypothetical protein